MLDRMHSLDEMEDYFGSGFDILGADLAASNLFRLSVAL